MLMGLTNWGFRHCRTIQLMGYRSLVVLLRWSGRVKRAISK